MKNTLVEAKKLVKHYSGSTVVDKVSFSVKKGEIFGILGPNGAGKTTTLEMLEAMRPIDEGQATINGIDVAKNPWEIKEIIGVQPQTPAFEEKTKLTELLELFAATYGRKVDARKLLDDVQLSDKYHSYAEKLSGGQKQRFSIATALVNNPKVLFLDEPTTGLDPQARRNLWDLVESIRKQAVTVILTTHYMEEAEVLCDRVAIMDNGKIIALDSPKQLVKNLLNKGFKKKQHVEQADLEDVFIDLTGRELRE
ncbi:MAG: ATP-binding cassette domain-containing protein [Candidatus Saccharibacteria bacterium]|nr:ATP-binding cassette domain-containing protein [Candidatus Saccharibacteria bacterium]